MMNYNTNVAAFVQAQKISGEKLLTNKLYYWWYSAISLILTQRDTIQLPNHRFCHKFKLEGYHEEWLPGFDKEWF